VKFDKELYKNFSKLYGVVYQDNQKFLNRVNDNFFINSTSLKGYLSKQEGVVIKLTQKIENFYNFDFKTFILVQKLC
jgi:hypothetical protein